MPEIQKLNTKNLSLLPKAVEIPAYDRSALKTGIVHIGIGGFHRAHQAYYTDQLLHLPHNTDWGICGVGLLDTDRKIIDTLIQQNGLYTLMTIRPDGAPTARIIGSIVGYLFAPENPEAVLEKMADPDVRIVTLTITEGGYRIDSAVFGYLAQALKRRRDREIAGLTLQSCDNIQHNGDVLKKILLAYVKETEPGLTDWVEKHVAFPNSMVDRITPVTVPADAERLKSVFGIEDAWPVVCEPFIQWVIEDKFSNGRPAWESVGAMFTGDVGPYEKMKLRLLNAGHSLLGMLGSLNGCSTIDEAVGIPWLRTFLCSFMDHEVTPVLDNMMDFNVEAYKDSLIERFGNPGMKDRLARICLESSAKIPVFVLPTIREQLERGGDIKRGTLIVAAWCRYLELSGTLGHPWEIQDAMKDVLLKRARESVDGDLLAFLKIEQVFGDLLRSKRFVETYCSLVDGLRTHGIKQSVINISDK